ncbi:MAG: hypothetical protein WCE79_09445 [Xanthobacteraceae bacterium]
MVQSIRWGKWSYRQPPRPLIVAMAATILLALAGTPALATVNDAYWAGTDVQRGNVNTATHVPTQVNGSFGAGGDVAVDSANGKIYWVDSTGAGIRVGNLNGTGSGTLLLTAPFSVRQLQIDTGTQTLYWSDNNKIYWTPLTNAVVHTLPLTPQTVRGFALDLRAAKRHLYFIDVYDVWRSDLTGANLTKLANPLTNGAVFGGLAIDTCGEQLVATIEEATGQPAAIVRADLADAGNLITLLETRPTVGAHPGKIMLDLNARQMYWTVRDDYGANGHSTVRRADLNGTNMQVLVGTAQAGEFFSGMGLDLALTECLTVGVNKDLQNNTGLAADEIHMVIEGTYTNVAHFDGYPAHQFASFVQGPDGNGNTVLHWSQPNNAVQPGEIVHVGFNVPGSFVNILSIAWTRNWAIIGCANQITTSTYAWGSPGSQVVYDNNVLQCAAVPRFVGGLVVEWHARTIALADLTARVRRKPLRTDTIRRDPIRLAPKARAAVTVPAAPRNAVSGVIIYKVSTNARLNGRDVTTDFVQFMVNRKRPVETPRESPPEAKRK